MAVLRVALLLGVASALGDTVPTPVRPAAESAYRRVLYPFRDGAIARSAGRGPSAGKAAGKGEDAPNFTRLGAAVAVAGMSRGLIDPLFAHPSIRAAAVVPLVRAVACVVLGGAGREPSALVRLLLLALGVSLPAALLAATAAQCRSFDMLALARLIAAVGSAALPLAQAVALGGGRRRPTSAHGRAEPAAALDICTLATRLGALSAADGLATSAGTLAGASLMRMQAAPPLQRVHLVCAATAACAAAALAAARPWRAPEADAERRRRPQGGRTCEPAIGGFVPPPPAILAAGACAMVAVEASRLAAAPYLGAVRLPALYPTAELGSRVVVMATLAPLLCRRVGAAASALISAGLMVCALAVVLGRPASIAGDLACLAMLGAGYALETSTAAVAAARAAPPAFAATFGMLHAASMLSLAPLVPGIELISRKGA